MKLEVEATIPFPREVVFAAYRDKLPELVPYLPNVRGIEVQSRREEGGRVELVNVWHGGGEIPAVARGFLSEALLSWTDYASWLRDDWTCLWRMKAHVFTEALRAEGVNRYTEVGALTRLTITGDLEIDGAKLKGVPRLFAGTAARTAEQIIVGRVRPNLLEVAAGVVRYLREHPPG